MFKKNLIYILLIVLLFAACIFQRIYNTSTNKKLRDELSGCYTILNATMAGIRQLNSGIKKRQEIIEKIQNEINRLSENRIVFENTNTELAKTITEFEISIERRYNTNTEFGKKLEQFTNKFQEIGKTIQKIKESNYD
jgi:septal ring factor EnvC (AmiA/AmiB activator)